eukprot:scaffold8374_cov175-Amphora_coffeaeformis.AAC.67
MIFVRLFLVGVGIVYLESSSAWTTTTSSSSHKRLISTSLASSRDVHCTPVFHRRDALRNAALIASSVFLKREPSFAAESSATAVITDKIYINVKGIPGTDEQKRIVIGLFGKDSPNSVAKLKSLVTSQGLPAPCRPKAERVLQKEQLEANKVYNACIEGEDQGVTLQYSQIWRIIRDERIDMGSVLGKFVAREYPDWQDAPNSFKHDSPGVVSVRRGNEGGFGFCIYPGNGSSPTYLDDEHIVVGRVIEGLDIVEALNQVPVVQSSKVNYMALTGGTTTKNAPTRACRYGGPSTFDLTFNKPPSLLILSKSLTFAFHVCLLAVYCNEFKPLVKLSITQTGVV